MYHMKKTLSLLLSAALGMIASSPAGAAPLSPEALLGPQKTTAPLRLIGERPSTGAASTLDFPDRVAGRLPGGTWGPLHPVSVSAPGSARQAPEPAAARALATDVNLLGQLIYDNGNEYNPDGNDWLGFYALPHSTGAAWSLAGYTDGPVNRGGYADLDDKVFRGVYMESFGNAIAFKYLVTFDLNTFQTLQVTEMSKDNFDLVGFGVDRNPVDGKVYGCYINSAGNGICWGTADYQAGTVTPIAELSLDERLLGVAFSETGEAYGLRETTYGSRALELVKVDKATGAQEVIGATQLPFRYSFGCCWNPVNNTILATYNTEDQGSGLMEIDPVTAAATLVSDFQSDRQVVNLFIRPDTKDKVPAAPQLTVEAPDGSMTCHYAITLPEALADGTPLTGLVEWRITLEGETRFEGANQAGSTVTGEITLDKTGYAEFLAYAFNKEGKSENAKVRLFVGKGLAASPAVVTLTWDEASSTMSASWDAVAASSDGGYINPSEVTYTVTDLEGNILSANQSATTFSRQMTAPEGRTEFAWSVTANYDGRSSAPTKSNSIFLGAMMPPYEYDFTKRKEFVQDGYTVIDANNDGISFAPNGLGARCGHAEQKINMDDWLVLPGIFLEAGKSYLFTLTAHCYQNTNAEIVEVKAGTAPEASALTLQIIKQTTIKSNRLEPSVLTGVITPASSGVWYIGVHAKSTANKGVTTYHVMVPHVSLGAPMDPNCPNAPTEVTLTAAQDGSLVAGVGYTAPSSSMGGTSYAGGPSGPPKMMKMQVFVGDETEPRQTMSVPGGYKGTFPQPVTFDERGDKTVRVIAETPTGEQSIAVEATAYVGPYEPKQPSNVRLTEVYQPGTVRLEWDPVTQDVNGNPLPAGHTSYMVFGLDENRQPVAMLEEPIQSTVYTFDALEDVSEQHFVQYYVGTYNWDFLSSKLGTSTYIPVGVPYTLPVKYSNMADLDNKACAFASRGYGQFGIVRDGIIVSQDGDGEFYCGRAQYTNDAGLLRTGIISLVGAKNPEVVLYTYKAVEGDDNIVQVSVISNNQEEVIRFDRHDDMEVGVWTKCRYDLSKWRNKNVQIVVTLGCLHFQDSYADNITIQDTPDFDVAVTSLTAPARIAAGKNFNLAATVENTGYKAVGEYEISLFRNGEKVETRTLSGLDVDGLARVEFTSMLDNFLENDKAEYHVEVALADDGNASNNVSKPVTVDRRRSTLPGPEELQGEATQEGNLITWMPVSGPGAGETYTEDFETGEAWAPYFGDWTFVDRDGAPLGVINEIEIPGIEHGKTTGSFFVFDMEAYGETTLQNLNTHSGDRFLFSLYRRDNRQVDDWVISPLLNGKEQTVSFFAKRLAEQYMEEIEVLYTFEDSFSYEDYTKVEGFGIKIVPSEWTEYTALIPEGATHFAIRSRAANGMMLMIDDVTFMPQKPELKGYHIYRDGVRLNEAPLGETSYLDTSAGTDARTYHVSAVYAEGESELSRPLSLQFSGLSSAVAEGLSVMVEGRDIIVSGAGIAPVRLAAVDGRTLDRALGDTRFTVPSAGVYLLTVGSRTVKVLVK